MATPGESRVRMSAQYAFGPETEFDPIVSNILVPVDFSERSAGAARFAVQFAYSVHARVTLLHVERPPEGNLFRMAEVVRSLEQRMSAFLSESARNPSLQRIVRVHPDVAGTILRHAEENGADLIALPTHGYSGIRRVLRGSVTAKLLRNAPCPVWTTAQTFAATPVDWLDPERILCAAGTASEGDRIMTWASRLAAHLKARLCIAWSRKGVREEPEEIDRVQRRYRIDAEMVFEPEDVPEVLRDAVAWLRAGLLVIGRSGGRAKAPWGSGGYDIVREVPCPVISV
jgi:nucleotide-binding universal stress UspA family protein